MQYAIRVECEDESSLSVKTSEATYAQNLSNKLKRIEQPNDTYNALLF